MLAKLIGGPYDGDEVNKPDKRQRHKDGHAYTRNISKDRVAIYLWKRKRKAWIFYKIITATTRKEVTEFMNKEFYNKELPNEDSKDCRAGGQQIREDDQSP
jgi:hypothetical protein